MLINSTFRVKLRCCGLFMKSKVHLSKRLCSIRRQPTNEIHEIQDEIKNISPYKNFILNTDPKVEALKGKLLYSEYLSLERIKFGYKRRAIFAFNLRNKKKREYVNKQMSEPAYSVILNSVKNNTEFNHSKTECRTVNDEEPIRLEEDEKDLMYMPYSNTDKFDVTETITDTAIENVDTKNLEKEEINTAYKILYEKYLEAKSKMHGRSLSFEEFENNYLESFPLSKEEIKIHHNWMTDYHVYNDAIDDPSDLLYGTPNPNSEISSIPCGGCGAPLHCKDPAIPGYLPSEIFSNANREVLKVMICQRCHFMKYYRTALEVKVSSEEYPKLLKVIKAKKCAVLLMVDLTDFPCSIWPDIKSVLHPRTPVFVVANKIDLLPEDSSNFQEHIRQCVKQAVLDYTGINKENIKHVALISAKTKYGVEELINKLHKLWEYKGDVYVIGCTNVGKSSLFNVLLQSDYCKVQAVDVVQRATISPWPGTTLNLLKFPILNPVRWRLKWRTERLISEAEEKSIEIKLKKLQYLTSRNLKDATLTGHVGRTFYSKPQKSFSDPYSPNSHKESNSNFALDETLPEFRESRWCYDTPGTIQHQQILDLLTTKELMKTLPQQIISPRTYIFKPQQTIFVGGLGRLDYLEGETFIRCTVFASENLYVTMCSTIDAEYLYEELLHTKAFGVPINDPERLKIWPPLEGKEMFVTGIDEAESVADVVLSSAGWIALTPDSEQKIKVKAWTPNGRGIYLRMPALLRKSVTFRGLRVSSTPAYSKGKRIHISKNLNI